MKEYSTVGKRLPRVDAVEKVTGSAKYGVDLKLPGMLYGKILRSIYPHARILNIDTSKAKKLPGVRSVITAEDTSRIKFASSPLWNLKDEPLLAIDKVCYIGDEVVAVAAIDEDVAEEALDLIEVEYDPLPAVFDPEEAIKSDAPKIHDPKGNITTDFQFGNGDIAKGFKEADHIFEDRFMTQLVHQCHLEPTMCIADFDVSGKLTMWITSMTPSDIQIILAKILDLPESKIRIVQPHQGGAFGAKAQVTRIYPICALLSKKTGRPVKMVNTREEEFATTHPRIPAIIRLKTGVKKDGRLVATNISIISNHGAYAGCGPFIPMFMGTAPVCLYSISNFKVEVKTVYTNQTAIGTFRGFGYPQMMFAFESQMDMIAERLEIDPIELRLKNSVKTGDTTVMGWEIKSCGFKECLQKVAQHANWNTKRAEKKLNRGIGVAASIFTSDARVFDFGGSNALIKISGDGRISIITGEVEWGQGSRTIFSQIAAEELGVPVEDIEFLSVDTDITPYTLGPWGDRVTVSGGNAIRLAAIDARRQLFEIAGEMLEVSPEDLEARDRKVRVRGSPEKAKSIKEIASYAIYRKGGSAIIGKGTDERETVTSDPETMKGNVCSSYTFVAQIAEVEVDPETGKVKVLDFITTNDLGRAINPMAAEGQAEGSVVQGMGYGLTEGIVYIDGNVINPNFTDYRLIGALDAPPITTFLIESNDPNGPYGAKGCGEPSIVPVAPAIANAIYDAIGVRIKELPITPEQILTGLEEKSVEDTKHR